MKAIAIFALVAFLCVPAFADPPTEFDPTDNVCTITLTVGTYFEVDVEQTETITISNGDTWGVCGVQWSFEANIAVDIDAIVAGDHEDIWDWTENFEPAASYGPGTGGGTITVRVGSVGLAEDNAGTHSATLTMTITPDA
jgi:hypothetical protein